MSGRVALRRLEEALAHVAELVELAREHVAHLAAIERPDITPHLDEERPAQPRP